MQKIKVEVDSAIHSLGIEDVGHASIRELVKLVSIVEENTGIKFIRMEMGIPGLKPSETGTKAEIEALKKGVAAIYPSIEGIPDLKKEASRFLKLFLNIEISSSSIIPSVGSMQGGCATFMVSCRRDASKTKTLFIDPGFPVQKQQHKVLGLDYVSFDVYDFRGNQLKKKLESYLKKGDISTILYSNPNNPSWICFNEEELSIIGELATLYDTIVIEDLAYFGMDFRKDYNVPGVAPYQPTVARYTDNYVLLISSSKIFSYAGQRLGLIAVSDKLYNQKYPDLKQYFTSAAFGHALVFGALYALSSGTAHSTQYAVAAILKAVNDGKINLTSEVKEYGERAAIMKKIFKKYGFNIVYDTDVDEPIADGFYFTFSYPGLSGAELVKELLYYGISAISLDITGSKRSEGLRACVSLIKRSQFADLEERLIQFQKDHS